MWRNLAARGHDVVAPPSFRIATVVQARMGSARLPGKSMRVLAGRPMVMHVMERASAVGYPVVLATSVNERDDLLAADVARAGYTVVRGSEWDVLARVAEAAEAMRADVIVRVTGDCPLLAPDVCAQVVDLWMQARVGIASNDTTHSGYPDGLDVEVFGIGLLREAARRASAREDREHVTPWMRRTTAHHILSNTEDWRRIKLSVDSAEDFERVSRVMGVVGRGELAWTATRSALLSSIGGVE